MNEGYFFTETEWAEFRACYRHLVDITHETFTYDDRRQ